MVWIASIRVANLAMTGVGDLREIIVIARRVSVAKRNERNEAIYSGELWIKGESRTLGESVV